MSGTLCRHCTRIINQDADGRWIDPEADGDDIIWRETCDANHEDRIAAHEPEDIPEPPRDRMKNPSINFPQSEEEAAQAIIHQTRRILFEQQFGLSHVYAVDSGLGTSRTQQQADWLNNQQSIIRARLEDLLDEHRLLS